MKLKNYLEEMPRGYATELANELSAMGGIPISLSFLLQMSSGASAISPERCVLIEQATNGAVTRKDRRPDDWERIWPELSKDFA